MRDQPPTLNVAERPGPSPWLALAMVLLISGCSWISMDRAPSTPERACTDANTYATMDGVYAITNLLAAAEIGEEATVVGLVLAIAFGASAITGVTWADECRASQHGARPAARREGSGRFVWLTPSPSAWIRAPEAPAER